MKSCTGCHRKLPLASFWAKKQTKDGKDHKCKECARQRGTIWRAANKDKNVISQKKWRENNKSKMIECRENWSKNNPHAHAEFIRRSIKKSPEKQKARMLLFRAVRNGSIFKGKCEVCGNEKSEAHHADYSKPLDVKWLCKKHHTEVHFNITTHE